MQSVEHRLLESEKRAAEARARNAFEDASAQRVLRAAALGLIGVGIVYAHLAHAHEDWSTAARFYAAALGILALVSVASMRRDRIPFVPFAATQMYVYYGLGTFGAADLTGHVGPIPLRGESLEAAAFAVLLCTAALLVSTPAGRRAGSWIEPRLARVLPRLSGEELRVIAVPFGIAMLAATYVSVFAGDSVPGSVAFVFYTMTRPALGQAVLSAAASVPGAPRWLDRAFLAFTVGASVIGLSSGSLAPGLAPWVSHGVFVWLRRGTVPWRWGVLVLLLFVVLNPAKHIFREMVWWGGEEAQIGFSDRFDAWQTAVSRTWSEDRSTEENVETSADRLGTLVYAAQAFEWVPGQVPHSGVERWTSIPAAYIPRVLWEDKPDLTRVNNVAYTTTFGLQSDRGARFSTLVFPLVFDAYWALGWLGVVVAGVAVGLLLGAYEAAFPPRDWAAAAVGVTLMGGLSVHAHLALTLTGVPQSIVGALAVLWVVTLAARAAAGRRASSR